MKDFITFVKSNAVAKIVAGIGVIVIALFIFEAGVIIGFHKAQFAEHWQDNYGRNFGFDIPGPDIPNAHGATGKIVSVTLPTFVILGASENEKTIRIDDDTIIRDGAGTMTTDDIVVGKYATVIGMPDDAGEIEASFIRIMTTPAASTTAQ